MVLMETRCDALVALVLISSLVSHEEVLELRHL